MAKHRAVERSVKFVVKCKKMKIINANWSCLSRAGPVLIRGLKLLGATVIG